MQKKKRQEESRTRWMLGICNSPHAAAWLKVYRLPSAAVNPPRLTASMDDGRHRGLGKLVFDKVRASDSGTACFLVGLLTLSTL